MAVWSGKKVAVLYGGRSTEREVSLRTGKGCAEALASKGHDVELVDVDLEVAAKLRSMKAAVAFIALHGRWGEDGCIQGLLESLAIPYTGSGVLSSALGMDKVISKLMFKQAGLAVTEYRVFPRAQARDVTVGDLPFGLPAVVKPAGEGSSVGVHIVKEASELTGACVDAAQYQGDLIVERFVKGAEVDVAVLDGEALGAIEIVPSREFYDYTAKYTPGMTQYHYPPRLPADHLASAMQAAVGAHQALGCSGVTRIDFIVNTDGVPYILEANTMPGMTATSLVPKIAAGAGIPFADLCDRLLDGAGLRA
jgi:D-alanine-D-alanine ligase